MYSDFAVKVAASRLKSTTSYLQLRLHLGIVCVYIPYGAVNKQIARGRIMELNFNGIII